MAIGNNTIHGAVKPEICFRSALNACWLMIQRLYGNFHPEEWNFMTSKVSKSLEVIYGHDSASERER